MPEFWQRIVIAVVMIAVASAIASTIARMTASWMTPPIAVDHW